MSSSLKEIITIGLTLLNVIGYNVLRSLTTEEMVVVPRVWFAYYLANFNWSGTYWALGIATKKYFGTVKQIAK